jgi:DNA-binding PadR family transcriptional regulator
MGKREGDVPTLSGKEALVMEMLIQRELCGAELVSRSGGALGRGTVYVTLSRMEDKGLVESRDEERAPGAIGVPRRLYKATGLGQRVWTATVAASSAFFSAFAVEGR